MTTLVKPGQSIISKYDSIFKGVLALIEIDSAQSKKEAKQQLNFLYEEICKFPEQNSFLQEIYFINALNKRLANKNWKVPNLYLLDDNNKQLEAFTIMANQFPFVTESQKIANQTLLNHLTGEDNICLIDIGIGQGRQIIAVLKQLLLSGKKPSKITVIGIEPTVNSLNIACEQLNALSVEYKAKTEVFPINNTIEELTAKDWELIAKSSKSTKTVINASFSLHHSLPEKREEIFAQIKALNPSVFTIIEPYADYLAPSLQYKFNEAWKHYALTFRALDLLDITEENNTFVKSCFFGREIEDVFSESSIERYEKSEMWLDYAYQVGFKSTDFSPVLASLTKHNDIQVIDKEDYISLEIDNETVVGVMAIY